MTTLQLNAEIYRSMGVIAEDENLLNLACRYLKKLAAKKVDEEAMTYDQLMSKISKAESDYAQGKTFAMMPGEDFQEFRKRVGV